MHNQHPQGQGTPHPMVATPCPGTDQTAEPHVHQGHHPARQSGHGHHPANYPAQPTADAQYPAGQYPIGQHAHVAQGQYPIHAQYAAHGNYPGQGYYHGAPSAQLASAQTITVKRSGAMQGIGIALMVVALPTALVCFYNYFIDPRGGISKREVEAVVLPSFILVAISSFLIRRGGQRIAATTEALHQRTAARKHTRARRWAFVKGPGKWLALASCALVGTALSGDTAMRMYDRAEASLATAEYMDQQAEAIVDEGAYDAEERSAWKRESSAMARQWANDAQEEGHIYAGTTAGCAIALLAMLGLARRSRRTLVA